MNKLPIFGTETLYIETQHIVVNRRGRVDRLPVSGKKSLKFIVKYKPMNLNQKGNPE
jgi:hypothetical protein